MTIQISLVSLSLVEENIGMRQKCICSFLQRLFTNILALREECGLLFIEYYIYDRHFKTPSSRTALSTNNGLIVQSACVTKWLLSFFKNKFTGNSTYSKCRLISFYRLKKYKGVSLSSHIRRFKWIFAADFYCTVNIIAILVLICKLVPVLCIKSYSSVSKYIGCLCMIINFLLNKALKY